MLVLCVICAVVSAAPEDEASGSGQSELQSWESHHTVWLLVLLSSLCAAMACFRVMRFVQAKKQKNLHIAKLAGSELTSVATFTANTFSHMKDGVHDLLHSHAHHDLEDSDDESNYRSLQVTSRTSRKQSSSMHASSRWQTPTTANLAPSSLPPELAGMCLLDLGPPTARRSLTPLDEVARKASSAGRRSLSPPVPPPPRSRSLSQPSAFQNVVRKSGGEDTFANVSPLSPALSLQGLEQTPPATRNKGRRVTLSPRPRDRPAWALPPLEKVPVVT
ncbi:hypothetical protein DIPPA_34919 [Diplonema papillatum]|nr:hypothetical protein DIPPA_34919 [Diplonema papillatum]